MVKKDTCESLENLFFDNPLTSFRARTLARQVHITHPAITPYLAYLRTHGIILQNPDGSWKAKQGLLFSRLKKVRTIQRLYKTGLVDYLVQETTPRAIILFGSASKGEDIETSDIDIFVESAEKKLFLHKFDKLLHKKVNITFGSFERLTKQFKNSLINGTILYGGIEI